MKTKKYLLFFIGTLLTPLSSTSATDNTAEVSTAMVASTCASFASLVCNIISVALHWDNWENKELEKGASIVTILVAILLFVLGCASCCTRLFTTHKSHRPFDIIIFNFMSLISIAFSVVLLIFDCQKGFWSCCMFSGWSFGLNALAIVIPIVVLICGLLHCNRRKNTTAYEDITSMIEMS